MHILLTGGTGLMGRALCEHWHRAGHQLSVWSRTPHKVRMLCGDDVKGVSQLAELDNMHLDVVVNLAGAPIADRPWTDARKTLLLDSRIILTQQLINWLATKKQRPEVLLSGSAVGWYGNGKELVLSEKRPPVTHDFGHKLCQAWELSAQGAEPLGIRLITLRTGLALARNGGFLKRLLPVFRLGLGGKLGDGQQWMPWIHLADQVALIDFLIMHPTAQGPFNACSPNPVRNDEFTRILGQVLQRPTLLNVPAPVLNLLLGELAGLLLGGQRAVPDRLLAAGFQFQFTDLKAALTELLSNTPAASQ